MEQKNVKVMLAYTIYFLYTIYCRMVLSYILNNKYHHHNIFEYMLYTSYILFAIAFTGVYSVDPYYLTTLNELIKYYVCIFLLVQFNPYSKIKCEDYEINRKIVFSAGIFLLLTTGITDYALLKLQI